MKLLFNRKEKKQDLVSLMVTIFLFFLVNISCQEVENEFCNIKKNQKKLFSFGIIADTQWGDKDQKWNRSYRKALDKLKESVINLNKHDLLFTIQLGDLIDGRNALKESRLNLKKVVDVYNELKMQHYRVIGNHCILSGKKYLMKVLGMQKKYYSFTFKEVLGWRFIVLDGTDEDLGVLGEEQLKWFEDTLDTASSNEEKIIIFNHYALLKSAAKKEQMKKPKPVLKLIEKYPCVVAYFAGHDHAGGYSFHRGVHHVTLKGMVESPQNNAYAIVDVYSTKLVENGFGNEPSRELNLSHSNPSFEFMSSEERYTLFPKDTGAALVNPGMGWTLMFYSNIPQTYGSRLLPSDTVDNWPGLAVVYLRIPWAFLEPEEGKFNWALLDTPAQRWIAKGKRVAFRITCSENWMNFATPEWVKNAGAKGVFFKWGKGPQPNGKLWDPDFADHIFLSKLDNLLRAMSARYNGNPNVAFIDIGTYGMWGEGHTGGSSRIPQARANEIIRQHINLHLKYFPDTQLVISDDATGPRSKGAHQPVTDYALSKGVTLRDDSICVAPPPSSWHHAGMAQLFWPTLPVIVEHQHYGASKKRNAWGNGRLLIKAIEDYHASYVTIHWWPHKMLNENRKIVEDINLRLGYRLQLRKVIWPKCLTVGKPFEIETKWANAGVAPFYLGGFMAFTIKDEKGGIVAVLADDKLNLRELKVGSIGDTPVKNCLRQFTVGLTAPVTSSGDYTLFVSVGRRDGTPLIALPLEGDDGQHRYRLGKINIIK